MPSETIKSLLMIILFCSLETTLHLPRLVNSQMGERCRRATTLLRAYWSTHMPVAAMVRSSRRRSATLWRNLRRSVNFIRLEKAL
jgi:hypothetical protein